MALVRIWSILKVSGVGYHELHSEGDLGLRADTLFPVQKPEEEIILQSEHIANWPTVIGRLEAFIIHVYMLQMYE